jgi:nucleoside-triphosphatase THEP1
MEESQAKPGTPKRLSFSIAELAQSKAGYLAYRSSRRVERASYVIAAMTVVLIVLTILLILKSKP